MDGLILLHREPARHYDGEENGERPPLANPFFITCWLPNCLSFLPVLIEADGKSQSLLLINQMSQTCDSHGLTCSVSYAMLCSTNVSYIVHINLIKIA